MKAMFILCFLVLALSAFSASTVYAFDNFAAIQTAVDAANGEGHLSAQLDKSEDVLPGKSTEQLVDIIAAATFDATDSDDLAVDLTFMGGATVGKVIKLNPIASVVVGEPLNVSGTTELEDSYHLVLSTISGPVELSPQTAKVENGTFSATFGTTSAVSGTYVMQAEDMEGNIDREPFELLSSASASTEEGIGRIEAVKHSEAIVVFDMPGCVVIGETVDVRGVTTAKGNLDIVIDDILMADDLSIDYNNEFEWEWNTGKPLPNMGSYTQGVSALKAYLNCHVAGVSAGDYVRKEYKYLEPDGVTGIFLHSPWVFAEINESSIAKGDPITVQGVATGADTVDIVIIGPEGLKKMSDSFFSGDAIADGLFFTSVEVSGWREGKRFEESIRIPEDADAGNYQLLVLTPGRDGFYALTTREGGELFNALMDYCCTANDFVGRDQTQLMEIIENATFSSRGSDDIATILPFNVEYKTWHVDDDFLDYPNANFSLIHDAVNASSDGDVIIVYNGTYVENVDVNKSITIVSASGAENTIVQAETSNDHVFEVTADYVNISGFTVNNAIADSKVGISLDGVEHCNLSDNNVSNNWYGIWLFSSSNNTLTTNTCNLNNDNGISLVNSSNNILFHNTVNNNRNNGIYIYCSSNNNLTQDNMATNNKKNLCVGGYSKEDYEHDIDTTNTVNGKPVHYYFGQSDLVLDNLATKHITVANCTNITIKNNNVSNGDAIVIAFTTDSFIQNNTANNNTYGICLNCYCTNNNIINNTANNNENTGIRLNIDCKNNKFINNTANGNFFGISLDSFGNDNNKFINNTLKSNAYGIDMGYSGSNEISGNTMSDISRYGILLLFSSTNKIYHNNFINNSDNVYSFNSTNVWNSTSPITYTYNGSTYTNYTGNYWDDYIFEGNDADGDGIGDTSYVIQNDNNDNYPLMEPWENYFATTGNIFDTGQPENPYPSIMGIHNGTIKPAHDVNVSKMYTYPCAGTGGHSEWVAFYNSTTGEEIANGTWEGYAVGDYHYIEFDKEFVLHEGVIYNYSIKTGSYPQIIHEPVFNTTSDGEITCTKFTDANGRVYYDWIPAIKLFL